MNRIPLYLLLIALFVGSCQARETTETEEVSEGPDTSDMIPLGTGTKYRVTRDGNGVKVKKGMKLIVNFTLMVDDSAIMVRDVMTPLILEPGFFPSGIEDALFDMEVGQAAFGVMPRSRATPFGIDEGNVTFNIEVMEPPELAVNKEDSLMLLEFHGITDGPNWIEKWDLSEPVRSWYGVEVSQEGRVTGLKLEANGLWGEFYDILSQGVLEQLNLRGNDIRGEVYLKGEMFGREAYYQQVYSGRGQTGTLKNRSALYAMLEPTPVFVAPHPDDIYELRGELLGYEKGSRFLFPDTLEIDPANDTVVINGFKGQFVPVDYIEEEYYVFTGFLSKYNPTKQVSQQFDKLHGWVESYGGFYKDENGEFSRRFENEVDHSSEHSSTYEYGIKEVGSMGWEAGSSRVMFPADSFKLQDMILLALNDWPQREEITGHYFDGNLPVFHRENYNSQPNDWTNVEVVYENGVFKSMKVSSEGGCFEEYKLELRDGYYIISDEAGC